MQIIFTDKINRKLFFQRNYSVAWNLPIEERILYFSYSKKRCKTNIWWNAVIFLWDLELC